MSVYIFTGPTLSPEEGRAELDATYLPPVSQGDVYRASLDHPQAIGIIDGYFECVPAVWHKEILWAMTEGIHVYGSASMGALRAVELAAFGMEGVGAVFEAYRDGMLEDDDEVAVAHGPAETGYRPVSVAMVNIRFTLSAALKARVISPATRVALERIGKSLLYPDRTFPRILADATDEGIPAGELQAFRDWLPHGEVNQKKTDALAMLRVMRRQLAENPERKRVAYSFEYTDMWEHARRDAGQFERDGIGPTRTVVQEKLLDELRLDGESYVRARQGALLRFLAVERTWTLGVSVTPEILDATTQMFQRERGLLEPTHVERWREEQHLDGERFTRFLEDETRLRQVEELEEQEVASYLPDHLRAIGEYGRLLARARDKQRVLESSGFQNPDLTDAGLTEDQLLLWYFETRLGRPVVPDVRGYARSLGFEDEDAFRRAVLREFLYSVRKGSLPTDDNLH
ncbi:MAG TPA: TfuA-like protein [Candidatus Methylomirabilis sp.]|nr:TfuA-like protein [Candidatus Methylomirabilis sp.]HSC71694.1 TfuA-like protein [Candidatus Methylomirabilis sp.]